MPFFSVSLVDSRGRITRKLIQVEAQVDLATYITAAGAVSTALEAITDLGMCRCDLIIDEQDAGFAFTANSNIDTGATFTGELYDANGKKASLKVPGIKMSFVGIDGSIDITQTEVKAVLDMYLQSAGILQLSDGQQIDHWLKGKLDK